MFIVTLLTVVSTLFNIDDYIFRQQEYLNAVSMNSDIIRPTHVLSILVQGKDAALGNVLSSDEPESKPKGYLKWGSKRSNMQTEIPFDLEFVIKYLFSLMVIFLSYNAISEDKERGTLRLALSNSVSKKALLAGKCISHGVVILSSTLFAFIISILLMTSNNLIHLSGHDLIRISLLFIVTNIYLILFLLLSILISTLTSSNKSSLMVLLQVWIVVVYLIPGLGGIVAEHWKSAPKKTDSELSSRLSAEASKIRNDYFDTFRDKGAKIDYASPVLKRAYNLERQARNIDINDEREYNHQLTSQSEFAFAVTQFSPAVLMDRIVTRIALTDIGEYDHFLDMVMQHLTSKPIEPPKGYHVPRFDTRTSSIEKSIVDTASFLLIMIIECMVLYVLAHIAFIRKDVR